MCVFLFYLVDTSPFLVKTSMIQSHLLGLFNIFLPFWGFLQWSPGELLTCRDKFRTAPPPDIPPFKLGEIEGWYGVLLTGYHILKLLSAHGVRPAHELLEEKLKQGYVLVHHPFCHCFHNIFHKSQ